MKIAVGMSGGVDSTIAVHRLREDGHTVIGLTMQIWDGSVPLPPAMRSACFGPDEPEELERVRALARRLGIEHVTVPLAADYKTRVLDYFRSEYLAGRTPNPCIRCNSALKFGLLLSGARSAGIAFDRFATGHYARVERDAASGRMLLKRAVHRDKDQSYFLAFLDQPQLAETLFPLGALSKTRVKEDARALGFDEVAEQPESQDFLACSDYGALFDRGAIRPGDMVNARGDVLGRHRGIVYYTVGQRKGLDLGGLAEPLYVIRLDAAANRVVVGPESELYADGLTAVDVNWIALAGLDAPLQAEVQVRLRSPAVEATLAPGRAADGRDGVSVTFAAPQRAVTPGQAAVFYSGDTVLGAGWIE